MRYLNNRIILNRFRKESIFKDPQRNFIVFPDDHPTTWIILRSGAPGELQSFAFYPDCVSYIAPDEKYDDFEELVNISASAILKRFPSLWGILTPWFDQHDIIYKCLDEYD